MEELRIAFLHLAPAAGDLARNQQLVERSIVLAADAGAKWILTPELVTTGYTFADSIGTDWIMSQPDAWMSRVCKLAHRHKVAIFLGHVERDAAHGTLHNSLFAISETGEIIGQHRKINTLRVGSEAWSTPGVETTVVNMQPCGLVGLLICADAYSPRNAAELRAKGARLLVSAAAWGPGLHGPNGEWERVTEQTGLPLFVSIARARMKSSISRTRTASSRTAAAGCCRWRRPSRRFSLSTGR